MNILAIDPGKLLSCGAIFSALEVGGVPVLVWSGEIRFRPLYPSPGGEYVGGFRPVPGGEAWLRGPMAEIVIEKPRIYPGGHCRPNDIVDLAWAGGRVLGQLVRESGCPRVTEVYPAEWKGQLKKPVHHNRVLQVLAPGELACLPPETVQKVTEAVEYYGRTGKVKYSWKGHNLLDAVALGLTYLGRLR